MGFYGNIRNTTSNSFKFDRIYSNRVLMDQNANSDGVFGGRYVLVEYEQALEENFVTNSYQNIYKVNFNEDNIKYYSKILKINEETGEIEDNSLLESLPAAYETEEMVEEDKVYYIKFDEEVDIASFPTGTIFHEKNFLAKAGEYTLYYTIGLNPNIKQITGIQLKGKDDSIKNFEENWYLYDENNIKQTLPGVNDNDWYTINYAVDKAIYGLGRGYDSTVWRKVYSENGIAKYVNIAELNSVVPTFALTADAPYEIPTEPHFDRDSTNVYYNLHLQTPWSFRVADVSDTNSVISSVLNNSESDITSRKPDIIYDSSGHYILKPNGTTILNENEITYTDYPGAIYFNRDGFNKNKSNHSRFWEDLSKNEIRLDNYNSGALYPNRDDPDNNTKKPYPDTKELSIILPAVGDTVAKMWDLIYGEERKQNISWDDANGKSDFADERLRLVHDDNYTPEDSETIAGVINSVHDLMGMIITDPQSSVDGESMPEDANEAHQWQIYYNSEEANNDFKKNAYYYAGTTTGFKEIEYPFKDDQGNTLETLEAFKNYFGDNTAGYTKVTNLKDIHEYVNDDSKDPIFINNENGNIYKRVDKNTESAIAGQLYYTIPTNLTYIDAVMRVNDGKEWYYHPDGNENIFQQLPIDGKEAALEDNNDYYWVSRELATQYGQETGAEDGNAYVMHVADAMPLFKCYTLRNENLGDIESNKIYNYKEIVNLNGYRIGNIKSFDELLEAEGIVNGEKNGAIYDIENVYYDTGNNADYYDPERDEWISGKTYKSRSVKDILFPVDGINTVYYSREFNNNLWFYTKRTWSSLIDAFSLASPTAFKYKLKTTRLKREGECYYFIFENSEEGNAKAEALKAWVEDDARETEQLNIKTAGYLPYILEFNRNKKDDGLNSNYYYFIADSTPQVAGYGIADKKSAYEGTLDNIFYTEKILYYLDETDNLYKKAEKISGYNFEETDDLYRKNNEYYIIDCGDFDEYFNIYEKFNTEIIKNNDDLDYYFGPKTQDKPYKPLVLGYSYKEYTWKELYGFARDVNTLHGWLLRLNELLQANDTKTRDSNTIQGCINQLNDLLEKFEPLIPGELYGVNQYGKLGPVALNSDNENGESWIKLESTFDENTGQMIFKIIHNNINNFIEDGGHTPLSDNASRATELANYVDTLGDTLETDSVNNDKAHDPFGFVPDDATGNRIVLHSPVIDNSGHVIGEKETVLKLADLLLETNGTANIGTLNSPNGNVTISSSDTLRSALNKLITHINAGSSNISLNEYNNYYINDVNNSMGDNVDNNDNINEAIAKLQWQLNHIANKPLTDLDSSSNRGSNTPIAATDTLGQGLNKLQAQINNINNQNIEGSGNENGIINNYCGIIRSDPEHIPTNLTTGLGSNEMSVPGVKSGWIWVCHSDAVPESGTQGESDYVAPQPEKNYVYIKTKNGVKIGSFTDNIDRNYWELLNAWQ